MHLFEGDVRVDVVDVTALADLDAASPRRGFVGDDVLFRLLVEHGKDTVFLVDLETEECIYVSPAVRRLLGFRPEALIGRPLTEFVHPDEVAEVLARSARRRQGHGPRAAATRMSHADGSWLSVVATASVAVSYRGRPVTVFTVAATPERARGRHGLRSARLLLRTEAADPYGPSAARHPR